MYYISEDANWSIYYDAYYITKNLNKQKLLKSSIRFSDKNISGKIVHYGTKHLLFNKKEFIEPNYNNKNIITCFHIEPNDNILHFNLKEISLRFNYIHTSNSKTKEKLIDLKVPDNKIIVIPLGVDTYLFRPVTQTEYLQIRTKLGIPNNSLCIGSFQKDGAGWSEGFVPKTIKGPDILCDVLKVLSQKYPIFVLLTGPARGYVKKKLDEYKISYKHIFEKNYFELVKYYNALDLYLTTSREEGGPKAIVESMACGIPLVTTNVGMAEDIIIEGKNGFICKSKRPLDELVEKSEFVLEKLDKNDYKKMAPKLASQYDWTNIARLYYEKMYSKLL